MVLYSKFTYGSQFSESFKNPLLVCREIKEIPSVNFYLKRPVLYKVFSLEIKYYRLKKWGERNHSVTKPTETCGGRTHNAAQQTDTHKPPGSSPIIIQTNYQVSIITYHIKYQVISRKYLVSSIQFQVSGSKKTQERACFCYLKLFHDFFFTRAISRRARTPKNKPKLHPLPNL